MLYESCMSWVSLSLSLSLSYLQYYVMLCYVMLRLDWKKRKEMKNEKWKMRLREDFVLLLSSLSSFDSFKNREEVKKLIIKNWKKQVTLERNKKHGTNMWLIDWLIDWLIECVSFLSILYIDRFVSSFVRSFVLSMYYVMLCEKCFVKRPN
jgi:hypothetical protein